MKRLAESIAEAYRAVYPAGRIPLHAPVIGDAEEELVTESLKTGVVSSIGPYVERFEREIADYTGAAFAVATVNGTTALELALRVAGVRPGDLVLCPDISFVATAAAIVHAGADPLFLPVERRRLGLDPVALQEFLAEETEVGRDGVLLHRSSGQPVTACVVTHDVGVPAMIEEICAICREWGIKVVEDAAEALGSWVGGKHCGTFGDAGIFSFNGNKIITTGGGGMIVTNDEAAASSAKHLSTTAKIAHPWRYDHDAVGFNYRLPNLNAAMGLAQLGKLPEFLRRKAEQADEIRSRVDADDWTWTVPSGVICNEWLLVGRVQSGGEALVEQLRLLDIDARPLWASISSMRPYSEYPRFQCARSAALPGTHLCLPNGLSP